MPSHHGGPSHGPPKPPDARGTPAKPWRPSGILQQAPRISERSARLRVRVQPRASREAILGWREDVLRVAVTAPPVDGEANQAVRRLLARVLGLAPSAVLVVRGERGRDKVVHIAGVTDAGVRARLAGRDGPE